MGWLAETREAGGREEVLGQLEAESCGVHVVWMDTETQRVQLILGIESGILVLSRRGARLSASLIPMQWPIAHT